MPVKDMSDLHQAVGAEGMADVMKNARQRVEVEPTAPNVNVPETTTGKLPPIISARQMANEALTAPKELIVGLLHQGSKMVLAASSKSFKTFSLMDMTLSVAAGEPWWEFKTNQGRVLYLNLELEPFFFRQRLLWIMNERGLNVDVLDHIDIQHLRGYCTDFKELRAVIAEAAGNKYAMIVLDPLYKVMAGRDENSAGAIGDLLNEFERLAVSTGAAVVYAHHFSKGNQAKKESIDRASGSGVFARDADCLLVMTKHETELTYTIDATLRNHRPVDPFCVVWKEPLMVRDNGSDPTKLKQGNGKQKKYVIADLLKVLGTDELIRAELERKFRATTGASEGSFDALFKQAQESDQIEKAADGKKWKAVHPSFPVGYNACTQQAA
jgi:hypothetical protein